MAFIWIVRGLLILDLLLLLSLPVRGIFGGSDLAGDGMAMGYAVIGAVLGGVVVGGLALAWRAAQAPWAMGVVAALIAGFTLFLIAILFVA